MATLTDNEGYWGLHVVGEGQRTHGDVGALPAEGEQDGAESLPDRGEEGRPGGGEDQLLLCEEEGVEEEESVRVQSCQEGPVGGDTGEVERGDRGML